MQHHFFSGFSTIDTVETGNYRLYDIALIHCDLLNHFHTRIGERVMRPEWGCAIWDYLMEPMTVTVRDLIVADAKRVCESDDRVSVENIAVVELDNGIRIDLALLYRPLAVVGTFSINFEKRETARLSGSIA